MRRLWWLLFILLSLPASAALRGEWESSGDMPIPYEPTYPFSYSCQVEITDHQVRRIKGYRAKVFAVGQVELNNAKTYVNSEDIQWKRVLLDFEGGGQIESEGPISFSVEGSSFGLRFEEGQFPIEDRVTLSATVALPLEGYVITPDQQSRTFTRADSELRIWTNIYGKPTKITRSMFVVCDKKK